MDCPNIDQLIELYHGRRDSALEDHVRGCSSCQADLEVFILAPTAFASELDLPDALVERALVGIPMPESRPKRREVSIGQGLTSGLLGTVTASAALVASGSAGAGEPMIFLVISLGVGMAATVLQMRLDRWVKTLELSELS